MYKISFSAHTFDVKIKSCANKEGKKMSQISQLDLQNLRHLIGGYETTQDKMKEYASQAKDEQVKQFFEEGIRSAAENKRTLMEFLR